MNHEEIVTSVFRDLQGQLPTALSARLLFHAPDILEKDGTKKWRGKITGSRRHTIFDARWCFFEVGVGKYLTSTSNCGGVGLICFTNNKKCGEGQHTASVSQLALRFALAHPHFEASRRGDPNQGVFSYYPGFSFPVNRAVADMKLLLEECLDSLDALSVQK